MIPSEGDLTTVNRKEDKCIEDEESRKRKRKKKQVTTPRPACSWVYFSREFIKDYSASHPTSGLKAATKAASGAWKLMSLEEKAKYTTRAREVWDNYLSSTPARELKLKRQTKLVTRCSPGRLLNVLKRLSAEQKDAVKSMGFGSLLNLRCRTLRRSLCLWLLERFNTIRRSLEICGERIPLSPRDVELIMGLPASGEDVVNSGPDDLIIELRKKYNASNRGISVRLLEELLAVQEAGEDFKRSFVLYVLGTLLCPTARLDVSPSFLHFLTNMDVVHQFNWGKFLLDRLVREVSRFRQGKQRAVGGCLLFLQLFYYESVAVEGLFDAAPADVPYLSSWGEEEIAEREKRERELGGYGFGEVICKDRGPGMGMLGCTPQVDGLPSRDVATAVDHSHLCALEWNKEIVGRNLKDGNVVDGDIEVVDSVRAPCQNRESGCREIVNYLKENDQLEQCMGACPLWDCNFTGSFEHLSLHFSSKHQNSGRRFKYNSPLTVSLRMNETFLVLQAEEDGLLFILNKGTENVGHTIMITCIGPSWSTEHFLYDLVSERGTSSLRLKAYTQNFPGQMEGTPQKDFLLVPLSHVDSSGQLNLQVRICNSAKLGSDGPF